MTEKIRLSDLERGWAELKTGNWTLPLVDHQRKLAEATDTLLEIARTALELSAAGANYAHADKLRQVRREPRSVHLRHLELAAIKAEEAHLAALAKVTR